MFRCSVIATLIASTGLFAANAEAQTTPSDEFKSAIGIASYATSATFEGFGSDDYSGFGIYGLLKVREASAGDVLIRASLASMDYDDGFGFTSTSFEASALFGKNMMNEGWKYYAGAGFFNETWDLDAFGSYTFNGPQLTIGGGYNFERVSIDIWVDFRSAGGYEIDQLEGESAGAAGIGISYRF